jgi:hypothetical protein
MGRRLLALAAAVAMIVGSLLLRDRRDKHSSTTSRPKVTCATEIAMVCDALAGSADVVTESPSTTADRLTRLDQSDIDAWVTAGPWPRLVDDARERAGRTRLFSRYDAAIARSPLVEAVFPDRQKVLSTKCGGNITWKCVGDVAKAGTWKAVGGDEQWGPVKLGIDSPSDTGFGLSAIGAATASYFNRADVSSTDLDDDAYRDWLAGLAHAVIRPSPSLVQMVAAGPAVLDAATSVEADANRVVGSSARNPKPVVVYLAPVTTVDVMLGITAGSTGDRAAALVRGKGGAALADAGWRTGSHAGPAGAPALPNPNGLPSVGVLDALRNRWQEASR